MMRRVLLGSVLAASLGVVAMANHPATFVLRSGERVSGELSYKGGTSYTLNGKDYPSNDIAIIEFVPGAPSAAELNQIPTVDNNPSEHERHVFVTRDGQVIFGKIYHISADGNTITFDRREGGRQDIAADNLARVYVNPAGARSVYASVLGNATPGAVATSGTITYGRSPGQTATPDGGPDHRAQYPAPSLPVGALIGRVGNGAPFGIGTQTQPLPMPASGRLMLGVNDNELADNGGAYTVIVSKQ